MQVQFQWEWHIMCISIWGRLYHPWSYQAICELDFRCVSTMLTATTYQVCGMSGLGWLEKQGKAQKRWNLMVLVHVKVSTAIAQKLDAFIIYSMTEEEGWIISAEGPGSGTISSFSHLGRKKINTVFSTCNGFR